MYHYLFDYRYCSDENVIRSLDKFGGWNSTRFCVCLQHSFYTSLGQGHRHHKRHVKITRRIFCATVIANFRATQLKIDRERWTSSSLFFIWTYKAINGSLKRWIHRREKNEFYHLKCTDMIRSPTQWMVLSFQPIQIEIACFWVCVLIKHTI